MCSVDSRRTREWLAERKAVSQGEASGFKPLEDKAHGHRALPDVRRCALDRALTDIADAEGARSTRFSLPNTWSLLRAVGAASALLHQHEHAAGDECVEVVLDLAGHTASPAEDPQLDVLVVGGTRHVGASPKLRAQFGCWAHETVAWQGFWVVQ